MLNVQHHCLVIGDGLDKSGVLEIDSLNVDGYHFPVLAANVLHE